MEIYFNPYPGPAKCEEEGISLAVGVADSLLRLKKECDRELSFRFSETQGDMTPSKFILIRNANIDLNIGSAIYKAGSDKREKLRFLLQQFSKGKVIKEDEILGVENWILSAIGTAAPILELAAKNRNIALTIPTESEWRVDILHFIERPEKLHNLWGQMDISKIVEHCIKELGNALERFSVCFHAVCCPGSLNSAPDPEQWERLEFFQTMERAQERDYKSDGKLIKSVGQTKYGHLLELRIKQSGYRLFFVYNKNTFPNIVVGGFYRKGVGDNSKAQNDAIQEAKKRIDAYCQTI